MPRIMIRCPTLGKDLSTGLTTEQIKFESLSGFTVNLHCPVCGKTHRWNCNQAWIEQDDAQSGP